MADRHPEVKATNTSLDIVDAIHEFNGASTATIAEELDLAKSTVHKHLKTLARRGYVRKRHGMYHVGLTFLNIGEYVRTRWPGYSVIEAAVLDLNGRTEEDVDFVVEQNGLVYTICESYHKWEKYPDSKAGYRAHLGDRYYMHSVASGKTILSTYDDARISRILDRWGLPTLTENTITNREDLFAELERIRGRDFAIGDEEYQDGLRSISQPIVLPEQEVLGALTVSGPAYRMTDQIFDDEIRPVLEETVTELEAQLERARAALGQKSISPL